MAQPTIWRVSVSRGNCLSSSTTALMALEIFLIHVLKNILIKEKPLMDAKSR
jgi:hypothetical protein